MPVNTKEKVHTANLQGVLEVDDHLVSLRSGNKIAGFAIEQGWDNLSHELKAEMLYKCYSAIERALKLD